MERMKGLEALLKHDVQMLCSMEDQIIRALPAMIMKARNPQLKQTLEQHLSETRTQRQRLDSIKDVLGANEDSVKNYSSALTNFMGKATKCSGMEGIIDEAQKVMAENLSPEVMDAAIIGACQKVEHFEIACYGTAKAYAQQLQQGQVTNLLQQTLNEEGDADKKLTSLAINNVNKTAEVMV